MSEYDIISWIPRGKYFVPFTLHHYSFCSGSYSFENNNFISISSAKLVDILVLFKIKIIFPYVTHTHTHTHGTLFW